VRVYDMKTGKLRHELRAEHKADYLEFAGPDRLLSLSYWDHKLTLWDVANGEKLKSVDLARTRRTAPAVSPGGHYGAATEEKVVRLFALPDLTPAGELELPSVPPFGPHCEGVAFAPDGTQVAALLQGQPKPRVVVFNLADGKQTADVAVDPFKSPFYDG